MCSFHLSLNLYNSPQEGAAGGVGGGRWAALSGLALRGAAWCPGGPQPCGSRVLLEGHCNKKPIERALVWARVAGLLCADAVWGYCAISRAGGPFSPGRLAARLSGNGNHHAAPLTGRWPAPSQWLSGTSRWGTGNVPQQEAVALN